MAVTWQQLRWEPRLHLPAGLRDSRPSCPPLQPPSRFSYRTHQVGWVPVDYLAV